MGPNDAVASPAFMMGGWDGGGISLVEAEFDAAVIEELRKLGVRVPPAPTWTEVLDRGHDRPGDRRTGYQRDSSFRDEEGNQ